MVEKKVSARSQDPGQRRILDRATRQRRLNRQLEALENDNFQDDPHANMPQLVKRLPQFDDDAETGKKKKKTRGDHFKLRFRKNFQALLEEQNLNVSDGPNYLTACAPPSNLPQRHFCTVCGFPSNYTCVSCGARYCCVKCLGTHQETRYRNVSRITGLRIHPSRESVIRIQHLRPLNQHDPMQRQRPPTWQPRNVLAYSSHHAKA